MDAAANNAGGVGPGVYAIITSTGSIPAGAHEACGKGITPDLLRRLYSVDEVVPIQVWRQVGAGLGKLGVSKLDTNGG